MLYFGNKSNTKFNLVIMNIPAVTMAACINVEPGILPLHLAPRTNCVDLPQAPINNAKNLLLLTNINQDWLHQQLPTSSSRII
jgi:hypothetical protein